jgi:hypothetical protein
VGRRVPGGRRSVRAVVAGVHARRVPAHPGRDLAGASHLAGVVLSSGLAVALGATDPTAENQTTRSASGCGLRRLVSAHTVRETVVIALRGAQLAPARPFRPGPSTARGFLGWLRSVPGDHSLGVDALLGAGPRDPASSGRYSRAGSA